MGLGIGVFSGFLFGLGTQKVQNGYFQVLPLSTQIFFLTKIIKEYSKKYFLHAENLESCPGDGEDFLFEPIFNLFNFVLTDSSKDVNTTTGSSYTNSNETTKNPDDSKYIVPHFGNTKICGIGWGTTTVFLSIFISKDFSSIYLQSFTDSNLACTKYLLQLRRSIQMK